jgi:hypothetical protein
MDRSVRPPIKSGYLNCTLAVLFLAITLVNLAFAAGKDKIDPADFPETAYVLSARVITADTGVTVRHNPACDNPQGAFMRGYCAEAGTQVVNNTHQYVQVIATLGPNTYTLIGNKLPPPGPYKARLLEDGSIELLGPSANGELHAHKFIVVAIEITEKPN